MVYVLSKQSTKSPDLIVISPMIEIYYPYFIDRETEAVVSIRHGA